MSHVAVVGMGYVGIPMAVLLAHAGHTVIGIQRRSERSGWKIDALNRGECPIANEPELPELLSDAAHSRLAVTDDFSGVSVCDFVLIDVQTPVDERHVPIYDSLKAACTDVGKYLRPGTVVIIESTVAPGTTLNVAKPILEQGSGLKAGLPDGFGLCFSYERVMVGKLVRNIRNLPKIIGGIDQASTDAAKTLYTSVVLNAGILTTDITTAEVAKTAENAYRDVQIAFANEIALVCESLKVDVFEVRSLVNSLSDRHMLLPGAGVGGHCLPKDPWLLLNAARPRPRPSMLATARMVNDQMPTHVADLLREGLAAAGVTGRPLVGILGYTFIENSDDDRNSPTLALLDKLEYRDIPYAVHDPYVRKEWINESIEATLRGCDAVVLMTAHDQYRTLTPSLLASLLRTKVAVDGRNVWDPRDFIDKGFIFKGIGKGKTNA